MPTDVEESGNQAQPSNVLVVQKERSVCTRKKASKNCALKTRCKPMENHHKHDWEKNIKRCGTNTSHEQACQPNTSMRNKTCCRSSPASKRKRCKGDHNNHSCRTPVSGNKSIDLSDDGVLFSVFKTFDSEDGARIVPKGSENNEKGRKGEGKKLDGQKLNGVTLISMRVVKFSNFNLLIHGVIKGHHRLSKECNSQKECHKVDFSEPRNGATLCCRKQLHQQEGTICGDQGQNKQANETKPQSLLCTKSTSSVDLNQLPNCHSANKNPLHNNSPVHTLLTNFIIESHDVTKDGANHHCECEICQHLVGDSSTQVLDKANILHKPGKIENAADKSGKVDGRLTPKNNLEVGNQAVKKEKAHNCKHKSSHPCVKPVEVSVKKSRHGSTWLVVLRRYTGVIIALSIHRRATNRTKSCKNSNNSNNTLQSTKHHQTNNCF
eukprot:m.4598 g.4598  ORF g.4598 m.4598 type:complete len:437 (-) comp3936_c0_seq1:36-1346(-)